MGCLGVHFALEKSEVVTLRAKDNDESRLDYLQDELEESYFESAPDLIAQTDKAWDAIHRTLTDGTIGWSNGTYPLSHAVLGGEVLYGHDDYIMSLKTPEQVRDVAQALRDITEDTFRAGYFRIDPEDYGFQVDPDDFAYTWHWFTVMREFYYRAAASGRYVLFTANQ